MGLFNFGKIGFCASSLNKPRESTISPTIVKKPPTISQSGLETNFTSIASPRNETDVSPTKKTMSPILTPKIISTTQPPTVTSDHIKHYYTNLVTKHYWNNANPKDTAKDSLKFTTTHTVLTTPKTSADTFNKVHDYLSKFQQAALSSLLKFDLYLPVTDREIAYLLQQILVVGMFTFHRLTAKNPSELDPISIAQISKLNLGFFTVKERRLLWQNLSLLECNLVQLCGLSREFLPLYSNQRRCQSMLELDYVKMPTDEEIIASQKYYKVALLILTAVRQLCDGLNQEFAGEQIDMDSRFGNRNLINALDIAYVNLSKKVPKHDLFNDQKLAARPMTLYLRKLSGKGNVTQWSKATISEQSTVNDQVFSYQSEFWDNPEYYVTEIKALLESKNLD